MLNILWLNVVEFQEHQYDEKCMVLKVKCFHEFIGHTVQKNQAKRRMRSELWLPYNNYSMFAEFPFVWKI